MQNNRKILNVDFNGIINCDIRGALVIETIKYFLYNRQQMSLMYNDLSVIIKKQEKQNVENNTVINKLNYNSIIKFNTLFII